MQTRWSAAGILLGLTLPLVAIANTTDAPQEIEPHPFGQRELFQFQWENDSRLPFDKSKETDRWYTQGIKFTGIFSRPEDKTNLAYAVGNWWCGKKSESDQTSCLSLLTHSVTLGQNIYTPARISVATPQPNDRPWAGWLYVNRAVLLSVPEAIGKPETQEKLDLTVGVTGPLSYAEQVQKWWHRGDLGILQFGTAPAPMGWDNQLKNELAVNIAYENRERSSCHLNDARNGTGLDGDFAYIYGWYGGTVLTAIKGGGEFRFGKNLQHYGSVEGWMPGAQPQIMAMDNIENVRAKNPAPSEGLQKKASSNDEPWYFLAGAEVRVVARNLFLDGNTFGSSPSVHKKTLVYDLWAGFSWKITQGNRISYRQVRRSPNFDIPPGQAAFQNFSIFTWTHAFD